MRRLSILVVAMSLAACGGDASTTDGSSSGGSGGSATSGAESGGGGAGGGGAEGGGSSSDEFQLNASTDADQAHGEHESQITATRTHAAMRLFVVDPESGPIPGIIIKMTGPDGRPYYTQETDSQGYAEVLVPINQRYEIEYLSLGRRNQTAQVTVPDGPNQDIRLTMRHRGWRPPPPTDPDSPSPREEAEGITLDGILFESGSANIDPSSHERLDRVVEYMEHRTSARLRIEGHTDNVGNPRRNQQLSQRRAEAVRQYMVDHGIDGERITAVGRGDEAPVASNDTEEGRAQNRRIEAIEL